MIARVSGGNLIEIIETIIDRSNDRAEVSKRDTYSHKRKEIRRENNVPYAIYDDSLSEE